MFERFKKFVENTNNPHFLAQAQSTKALIAFCEKHDQGGPRVDSLRECLKALEARDIREAIKHYRAVPLGGMGCFNDWWPKAGCEHETDEYACAVFDALVERWSRLMRLSEEKSLS
ncbi:MAG: hypothetical protein EPO07_17375 [Verrucomicrobia bacterium]|nr:MAG: hypothetical protein EPO07_17375 [Verrucomicrobiota bacterium]